MRSLRYLGTALKSWRQQWSSHIFLVVLLYAATTYFVVPLFQWAASALLVFGDIPYLALSNFAPMLLGSPMAALLLLLLGWCFLVVIYFELAVLFHGTANILYRRGYSLRAVLRLSLGRARTFRLRDAAFFVCYMLIILPFVSGFVSAKLLKEAIIPMDAAQFSAAHLPKVGVLLVVLAFAGFFNVRFIRVLPLVIVEKQRFTQAAKQSWEETKHRFGHYFWRVALVGILVEFLFAQVLAVLSWEQSWFDHLESAALVAAVANMSLLELVEIALHAIGTSLIAIIIIAPDSLPAPSPQQAGILSPTPQQKMVLPIPPAHPTATVLTRRRLLYRIITGILITGTAGIFVVGNARFLTSNDTINPLIISHRGVDAGNGVENTIPSLLLTARHKPDYVEMDIRETKDGQWVLMHDPSIQRLTGIKAVPRDLTLAQLTKLVAHENGHSAHLASFDDYLAAAESVHQKLIVEIKTSRNDSPGAYSRFFDKYAPRLLKDRDYLHSVSYDVVKIAKRKVPQLVVSLILPHNLLFSHTVADAYSAQEATLDPNFINAANAQHKQVWAWTIDSHNMMQRMMYLNVDGIITDDMSAMREIMREQTRHPTYAQRLNDYVTFTSVTQ